MNTTVAVYDTKPYDRQSFARVTVENIRRLAAGQPLVEGTLL